MAKNTNLESKCTYTDVVKYEHIALKTRRFRVTRGFLPALDGGILNTAMSPSVPASLNKFNRSWYVILLAAILFAIDFVMISLLLFRSYKLPIKL